MARVGSVGDVGRYRADHADTFIFSQAFYDHFGPEREFFQLAHDLVFKVPGIRAMLTPYGTVPASPENMRRALARGAALLVYPGGDHETYRASWHSAEIDFAHRTGFVRLALKHGVRIVPVVSIGGQETALFLGQGEHIARLLGVLGLGMAGCDVTVWPRVRLLSRRYCQRTHSWSRRVCQYGLLW